jgi:hypothetical protein
MSMAVPVLLGLLLAGLGLYAFMRASPAAIAGSLRVIGPVLLGLLGVVLLFLGRAAVGGMLISGAIAWLGSNRFSQRAKPSPGLRSSVRSAVLEMELDHDSGQLEGQVLAGRYQGRQLGELALDELLDLHRECAGDDESLRLLEAYLDGRFPAWRERLDPNESTGHGGPSRAGSMTKEEAYEILGLEAGASAAQVREAHRRLMQRVHPDVGGSSFLAARINEAKDVLLSKHG